MASVSDSLQVGTWRYPYDATRNPRQRALHACDAQEILFGGSSGPGKTDSLLASGVMFCLLIPNGKCFLFRRTFKMLELEIIPRLLSRIPPEVAKYNGGDHAFRFKNGAVLQLGYLANDADLLNYQGVEAQLVLWDELTQFTRYQYVYLRSRLRMAGDVADAMRKQGWVPRMIATSNPTGPGHEWCRTMFVDPSPGPDVNFWGGIQEDENPDGKRWMCYVPALAIHNPFLDIPAYMRQLAGLDPVLRRALEFGDWTVLEGVRFNQFRRHIHVIEPEQLPISMVGYPRAVGVDWGIASPFAAVWGALLPDNLVVVYREIGGPNLTAEQQVRLILEAEEPGERDVYRQIPVALDPSCWARAAHEAIKPVDPDAPAPGSIAWWYKKQLGGALVRAWNDRTAGAQMLDQALLVQGDGLPRILFYSTCPKSISTIPSLLRSKQNPNDVGSSPKQNDHWYDAVRYLLGQLIRGGIQRTPPSSAGLGRLLGEEDPQYRADLQLDRIGAEPPSRHRPRLPAMQPAKRGSYTDS